MKFKKILVVFGLAMALVLSSTSAAFAQDNSGDDAAALAIIGGSFGLYTTTTTAPITTTAGVIITIVMIINDQNEQVRAYLQDNPVAVRHDLYIGGGESARDLARIFSVPEQRQSAFAQILYENRSELAKLIGPREIDEESASQFTELIVDEMLKDEVMAEQLVLLRS